jgi:hypothetical protein
MATLEWVDWFNNRRLLEPIGNIPPAEAEASYYSATHRVRHGGVTQTQRASGKPGAVQDCVFAILEKLGLSSNSALPWLIYGANMHAWHIRGAVRHEAQSPDKLERGFCEFLLLVLHVAFS